MIGCYAMKHFDIAGPEFIGWARLMRPGSVLGPQQQFLVNAQMQCRSWGNQSTNLTAGLSQEEKNVGKHGDEGQAGKLLSAKKANQSVRTETGRLAAGKPRVRPYKGNSRVSLPASGRVARTRKNI